MGDVHGQFYDVKEIFRLGGHPDSTKYLFLGDYVDRGIYACEVLLVLFALKINWPNQMFLLRGNHECRQMTQFHNFREEVLQKYDQEVYDLLMDSFDQMPLACVVNGRYLALHGGISPEAMSMPELGKVNRVQEPPASGALCDILWSDPIDNQTGQMVHYFEPNESRGCSYYYGYAAINDFLVKNNLLSLIRAHEAQFEGFKAYLWQKGAFPQVITLFSAPNYCGTYANKGAIMKLRDNDMQIFQYNFTPKPDLFLHLGDAFTWSIPLLSRALIELFFGFLSHTSDALTNEKLNAADLSRLNPEMLRTLCVDLDDLKDHRGEGFSELERIVNEENRKLSLPSNEPRSTALPSKEHMVVVPEEKGSQANEQLTSSMFSIQKHEFEANEKRPHE